MIVMEFKKGDRVIGNGKSPIYEGRAGTVAYMSGTEYWVKFDDSGTVEGAVHAWCLDPLVAKAGSGSRAA